MNEGRVKRLESHLGQRKIAVVIPAYDVEDHIVDVLAGLPAYVHQIVVVDDGSTDRTAELARRRSSQDPRIAVIQHTENRGVGAAVVSGFKQALAAGADVVVKMDGDGQMPSERLPDLLIPLLDDVADASKGNRFRDFRTLQSMPWVRRVGNVLLSFLCKLATGYWTVFDPTNGFVALRREILARIQLDELATSYFFEISLLGHLYLADAAVRDVAMPARYGLETSKLRVFQVLLEFPPKLTWMLIRRLLLRYFVYDFSLVSAYLLSGVPLFLFGLVFGIVKWIKYSTLGVPAPTGTVMLAALPVILGFQLLLAAIGQDVQSVPKTAVSPSLSRFID